MSASLKFKTVENIGYNTLAKFLVFILQAITSVILTRSLLSSDYGVVGFAMVFISFLSQFADLGMNSAVIQKAKLDDRGLYTGFTIKVALGILMFAVSFLISPLAKSFFDSEAVVNVIRILALNFVISSFSFLPNSVLVRELNYRRLFVPQVGAAIVNSALSIVLVLSGFSFWSIVLANIGGVASSVVILNVLRPVRIKFCFDKKVAAEFMHFGGNIFLSGVIVFAIFNADNFVIGAFKGSDALGYYTVAFNWGAMVCTVLGGMMLSVLFPTFSRIQQDREKMKNAYIKVLEYAAFIGMFANLGLLIASKEFLFFILGHGTDKWLPALAAFRILCIYGIFRCLLEPVGNVVLAIGKSRELLVAQVIIAAFQLVLLYPSLHFFGIEGVAVLVTASYVSAYTILLRLLKQEFRLKLIEWVKPVYPALISSFVSVVALYGISHFIPFSLPGVVQKLVFYALIYFTIYGVTTGWKMLNEIKNVFIAIQLRERILHLGGKL